MKSKNLMPGIAALAFLTMSATAASARSLLYYYDFDTVDESGNLVVSGVNKGTGNLEPTVVNSNGTAAATAASKVIGGVFSDSGYSFSVNSDRTIWLPQARDSSLGCSTTNGFTISAWIKPPANTATSYQWYDIMGFALGNENAFLEYSNVKNTLRLYGISADNELGIVFNPNEWAHVAIVATPNSPNSYGTITLYHNGVESARATSKGIGTLKQVQIGEVVYKDGARRYVGWSPTAIDEFALFDYPATAEQVKWLTKHKPGQPTGGPGREMPLCWRFDKIVNDQTRTDNSGTGNIVTSHWLPWNDDEAFKGGGALQTINSYQMNDNHPFTFVATNTVDGLGATAGSGFSFSFWLRAVETPSAWSDFFGFVLGQQSLRLEWTISGSPIYFNAYGGQTPGIGWTAADKVNEGRTANVWQHIALAFNTENSNVDIYTNGFYSATATAKAPIGSSQRIEKITVGPGVYIPDKDGNGNTERYVAPTKQVVFDELAFFNYSISPEEIAWLGSNIPKLPPLSATNLARTVSADCSWAGGLASWNVLDGTGAATGRRSIYPSCEDTEVEVAVSIAAAATIANDTFVTPAKLKFTNGTGGESAAATLVPGANSMFEPENLEVGDGVALTVSPGAVVVADTLKFGAGAKIVFDMSNAGDEKVVKGISFDSCELPPGDSDLASHFAVRGGMYSIVVSDDGKTVNLKGMRGAIIFVL